MGLWHTLCVTVGLVYWKMITYCVPNDKSVQWHVALLSPHRPPPSQTRPWLSPPFFCFFLTNPLALICWNDRPHRPAANRMPSVCLSLSIQPAAALISPPPTSPRRDGGMDGWIGWSGWQGCGVLGGMGSPWLVRKAVSGPWEHRLFFGGGGSCLRRVSHSGSGRKRSHE